MKTNIAAFTADGSEYPEFVSINHAGYETVSIEIRGPKRLDENQAYIIPGEQVAVTMSKNDFITLLHDAHDALFEKEAK